MLRLAAATDPAWARFAWAQRDAVLLDHAHCEKKAAGAAVRLLFQHPERAAFQAPLAALAREELAHFEAVLVELARRGIRFGRQRAGPYGRALQAWVRSTARERLLDTLLISAAIEARSCERLGLLAEAMAADAPELARFYRGLLAAEARHHRIYVELAEQVAPADAVRERLLEALAHEAKVLADTPRDLPRLHAGGLAGP